MKAVLLLIAAVVLLLRLQEYLGPTPKSRPYHPVSIADLAANDPAHWSSKVHTHVETEGWLVYFKHEDDGDLHLRLCTAMEIKPMDRANCIVVELVPTMSSTSHAADHVVLGQKLRVRGIYRWDGELNHRWGEIHPCEMLEIIQ